MYYEFNRGNGFKVEHDEDIINLIDDDDDSHTLPSYLPLPTIKAERYQQVISLIDDDIHPPQSPRVKASKIEKSKRSLISVKLLTIS